MFDAIIEQLRRIARREVERVLRLSLQPRFGNIKEYDPKTHRVKVELQPEGVVTNWIPIESQWVGNGWGVIAVPSVGDQVKVTFPEYGSNQGIAVGRVYDERNPPPQGSKSGDLLFVHQSGMWFAMQTSSKKIRMHNSNATIELGDQGQSIVKLVREEFKALYNGHTHDHSAVPDQQMTDSHLTSVLKGN